MKKDVCKIIFIFGITLVFSGCLTTASQIEKQKIQEEVFNLRQGKAEVEAKFSDLALELRNMNGRIETLEISLSRVTEEGEQKSGEFQSDIQKTQGVLKALREEMVKLRETIRKLEKSQKAAVHSGN